MSLLEVFPFQGIIKANTDAVGWNCLNGTCVFHSLNGLDSNGKLLSKNISIDEEQLPARYIFWD